MAISSGKKNILITAGPTWAKIDDVRVIGNVATGETGILLAHKLLQKGFKITLFLGPANKSYTNKRIKIIRFAYFDELLSKLKRELHKKKYQFVVHSAAISDYKSAKERNGKIASDIDVLKITLVPTPKIIDIFKKVQPGICLIGFKFLPKSTKKKLLSESMSLIKRSRADLVVANTLDKNRYKAYLVNKSFISKAILSKNNTVKNITRFIEHRISDAN